MRPNTLARALIAAGAAVVLCAGVISAAAATRSSAHSGYRTPVDEPLVAAFEHTSQATNGSDFPTTFTLTKTIAPTWIPAGHDYEQEGFKLYRGRFYISVYDHTDNNGHLLILEPDGTLVKDISFVDGERTHAGGFSVYGDFAYVPLAVDAPHSSADILRINVDTFAVTTLFTVDYDHVGGVIYDPATNLLVGQDWDSRTFYEWTLSGKIVSKWQNPSDYVGYQDCQYVVYNKMLCSGATEGATTIGGFDLIDLADPEHPILNGLPSAFAGNAAEILATPAAGGTTLTMYSAGGGVSGTDGPIDELTTFVPNTHVDGRLAYPSLAAAFDNVGITDDSAVALGNFDGSGNSYSAEALAAAGLAPGATVTDRGVRLTWPGVPAGGPDDVAATGQVIPVAGSGTTLGFLGAAINGDQSGDVTVLYADGTTATESLVLPNWIDTATSDGDDVVATTAHFNRVTPGAARTPSIFAGFVPVTAGKRVTGVVLPDNANMHIFALGIGG